MAKGLFVLDSLESFLFFSFPAGVCAFLVATKHLDCFCFLIVGWKTTERKNTRNQTKLRVLVFTNKKHTQTEGRPNKTQTPPGKQETFGNTNTSPRCFCLSRVFFWFSRSSLKSLYKPQIHRVGLFLKNTVREHQHKQEHLEKTQRNKTFDKKQNLSSEFLCMFLFLWPYG